MEKRVTEENKVKGATEENQVKKTDEEDIQVAEDGYLRLPGWTTGRSKLSMPRPSQPTAMGVDITEVAWRELEQQRRARKAHSNPVTLLPASSMASSGSTSTAPRVMLKPATESKGPGEEVHEQQGEKALEGQVEKAPEKPRKVSASQGPKDPPKTGPVLRADQLDPEKSKQMKEMQAEQEERLDRLRQLQKKNKYV
jgi:hypothetical protein